jgi:TonB family protein
MLEKPTLFSFSGSIVFHLVCALVAGNYLFANTQPVPVKKIYRLEVIKKKPPIKKKKIELKKKVRKKIPKPIKPLKTIKVIQKQELLLVARVMPRTPVPQVRPRVTKTISQVIPVTNYTSTPMTRKVVTSVPRRVQPEYEATAVVSGPVSSFQSRSTAAPVAFTPHRAIRPAETTNVTTARQAISVVSHSAVRVRVASASPQKIGKIEEQYKVPGKVAMVDTSRTWAIKIPTRGPSAPKIFDSSDSGSDRTAYFEGAGKRRILASLVPRSIPNFTDEGALRSYRNRLRRIIGRAKKYPNVSRAKREEGQVVVRFNILRNGQVEKLGWLKKSPHEKLNQEALDAVKRSAPFAELPSEIPGAFLEIELPFKFQLN